MAKGIRSAPLDDCQFPACDHSTGFCVWQPLRSVVRHEGCDAYMFMYRVGVIYSYKHRLTRRYIHVSNRGDFVKWDGYRYVPITRAEALASVNFLGA